MILTTLWDCILYAAMITAPLIPLLYIFTIQVAQTMIDIFNSWMYGDDV
jgi:hypothetical protein